MLFPRIYGWKSYYLTTIASLHQHFHLRKVFNISNVEFR